MLPSFIHAGLILIGAAIMLLSIIKTKGVLDAAPLIVKSHRNSIVRLLKLHRLLMVGFVVGYIAVAVVFVLQLHLVGELFVSLIFLMGAAFVLMGILLQARMLTEIQSTFSSIVPICSRCRRVRSPETNAEDRDAWHDVEAYLADSGEWSLAPGVCPDCMDQLYGLKEQA